MRGVLLICILLFCRFSLDAQLYFNKHYSGDGGYYYFTSLIEWRQQIFILAHFNDPSLNSIYGSSAILTLNLNGDLVSIDTIRPTLKHFFAWPESLQILDDSTLFYVAHDSNYYHVMEFNPGSKKTRIRSVACPLGSLREKNAKKEAQKIN
ncbi:MAG: hypothetical protein IPO78_16170 [Saprospiraceae bacterium]|nr:hypothetical protein [Saprospiraceae bacterium]